MERLRQNIVIILVVIAMSFGMAIAEGKALTLRFAYVAPIGTINHEVGVKFKETIEKLSKGDIKVDLFPGGQLGTLPEMFGQLKKGSIDLFKTDLGVASILGGSKSLAVVFAPYLFRDQEHFEKFCESTIFKEIMGAIEKENGIKALGLLVDRSPRALTTRHKMVLVPGDLKGIKMRVGEVPIFVETFKIWAASLAVVPAAEMYNSLRQKLVDGQENGIDVVYGMKLYEIQQHFTAIDYVRSAEYLYANQQKWDSLSTTQKDMILNAAKMARAWGNEKLSESTLKWFDICRDQGMTIVIPPLKPWIDASKKVIEEQDGKMWPAGLYVKIQNIK